MKRYIKLYLLLLKINFVLLLTYRINFINNVLSSLFFSSMTIFSMMLLTARTSSVFGWTSHELLLLTAVYNVMFGIVYVLFALNFEELTRMVNKGELDGWLLKPVDIQFSISLWRIGYANLFRSIIATAYTYYLLFLLHIVPSVLTIMSFILCMLSSTLLIYSIAFLIMTLTIWFTRLNNLTELLYAINGITRYPREMYRNAGFFLFFILFPLTLVVVVPTRVLLNKASFVEITTLLFSSIIAFFLSRKFFQFALRFYTSVSG